MLGTMSQTTSRFSISASIEDLMIQRMLMGASISLPSPRWFNKIINNNFIISSSVISLIKYGRRYLY
ncbi:hypothetical protein MtrunA17_Chr3g0112581 [Medicago truncatula]|uniref:Uncharacterized protein n=1 Tax=Medicago truncatula TaxID=3880 RepID=A0A396IRE3_MEDTR|nr:hypothetical protein MtrunA17_Chr3g0112581 [Medicago truncatula]